MKEIRNLTIHFACETNRMKSLMCVVRNHEQADCGSPYQTVTIVWIARTSHVECAPPIQPLRYMATWNPFKPPCHSRLEAHFFFRIFFVFLGIVQKITQSMLPINYLLVNEKQNYGTWNKKNLSWFWYYQVAGWFSKPSSQHYYLLSPIQNFPCSKNLWKVNFNNFKKLIELT